MIVWPFKRRSEQRQSGGGYADAITAAIEAQASAQVADVSSTAAIEAAAGALSRAFMSAEVEGPSWVQEAVPPTWLAQVGRSLIREGASLSVIVMGGDGMVELVPAAFWNFENINPGAQEGERESTWEARVTTYGPSTSCTRLVSRDRLVFVRWGTSPGTRYRGQGPTSWAHTTARLGSEVERSLADEASGPLAQLLAVPQDGGDDGDDDPLKALKADIRGARGRALLVETVNSGWGEGKASAPQSDWKQSRLGPAMPPAMVELARDSFMRTLAATGTPPSLFTDSDGTSQREAVRRWHLNTVLPLARVVEHELSAKLETPVRLRFDSYAMDMVSRATVVAKLTQAGVAPGVALAAVGLVDDE